MAKRKTSKGGKRKTVDHAKSTTEATIEWQSKVDNVVQSLPIATPIPVVPTTPVPSGARTLLLTPQLSKDKDPKNKGKATSEYESVQVLIEVLTTLIAFDPDDDDDEYDKDESNAEEEDEFSELRQGLLESRREFVMGTSGGSCRMPCVLLS
jgi:hypothetical protein